jgi:hypothetical protein
VQLFGCLIKAGWYSESFFDLLRILQLLFKSLSHRNQPCPTNTNVSYYCEHMDLYNRPAKNLQLLDRCIFLSIVDILEFHHARQNIVHNVQIFIKSIQEDGPTCVQIRQALEHTPQVTNLNLKPFPFKISDSL